MGGGKREREKWEGGRERERERERERGAVVKIYYLLMNTIVAHSSE